MFKHLLPLCFALCATAAFGADLGVPVLSPPFKDLFVPNRLVTDAGVRLEQSRDVVVVPQFGLGHSVREREIKSGFAEVQHKVNAQAGGSVHLFEVISLSAAAKLPVYTIEASNRRFAALLTQPDDSRYRYDLFSGNNNISWTGEMGIQIGSTVILNLFYDQNRFESTTGASFAPREENLFGTRFIFRFK